LTGRLESSKPEKELRPNHPQDGRAQPFQDAIAGSADEIYEIM
jgi:hypothetical protein